MTKCLCTRKQASAYDCVLCVVSEVGSYPGRNVLASGCVLILEEMAPDLERACTKGLAAGAGARRHVTL